MEDEDKRTRRRTVSLSHREATLIDQARGDVPMARWLREAAIEKLSRDLGIPRDAVDTARRAAPRRRNYAEREEQARLRV
jgi:hypothetical protein